MGEEEKLHHNSLFDCFTTAYAEEQPICRFEAIFVGEMCDAGWSVKDIQEAIDEKYSSHSNSNIYKKYLNDRLWTHAPDGGTALKRWNQTHPDGTIFMRHVESDVHAKILTESAVDLMSYQSILERQLKRNWITSKASPNSRVAGRVLIAFTIDKQGKVLESKIAQHSNINAFDTIALKAVQRAQPFKPIPPVSNLSRLSVLATFMETSVGPGDPGAPHGAFSLLEKYVPLQLQLRWSKK